MLITDVLLEALSKFDKHPVWETYARKPYRTRAGRRYEACRESNGIARSHQILAHYGYLIKVGDGHMPNFGSFKITAKGYALIDALTFTRRMRRKGVARLL